MLSGGLLETVMSPLYTQKIKQAYVRDISKLLAGLENVSQLSTLRAARKHL